MTLREMTEQAEQLYFLLQNDEIDEQTFKDTLEAIGAEEKIDTYCNIIYQLAADNTALDAEIDRLSNKKQSNTKSIERMKQALDSFMKACKKAKEKTALYTISYRKSKKVNIIDMSVIPAEFLKVKTETNPDKTKIKAAIIDGTPVPGCEVVENDNIQIK